VTGASSPPVRHAGAAERSALAAVLARAFYDDPVMSWFFPDPARRARHNQRFFSMRLRQLLPHGETYTVDGELGAALWAVPDRWRLGPLESIRMAFALAPALGRRGLLISRGVETIEHAHPRTPHYYLAVLGTEPAAQGRGIGSALIRPMLESCDRDEVPAYLESSKERNIDFYARHGFRLTGEVRLPDGPPVWSMWRDPRP
jgi:ribosomal protein S18 acetylase RimI-like enzyme